MLIGCQLVVFRRFGILSPNLYACSRNVAVLSFNEDLAPVEGVSAGAGPLAGGEAFVAHQRLEGRPARRTKQDVFNLQLQALVARNADHLIHATLFQRFVNPRLGESGIGAERHLFAFGLLALDLGQQRLECSQPCINKGVRGSRKVGERDYQSDIWEYFRGGLAPIHVT